MGRRLADAFTAEVSHRSSRCLQDYHRPVFYEWQFQSLKHFPSNEVFLAVIHVSQAKCGSPPPHSFPAAP